MADLNIILLLLLLRVYALLTLSTDRFFSFFLFFALNISIWNPSKNRIYTHGMRAYRFHCCRINGYFFNQIIGFTFFVTVNLLYYKNFYSSTCIRILLCT